MRLNALIITIAWSSGKAEFAATESRRLKPSAWNGKSEFVCWAFQSAFSFDSQLYFCYNTAAAAAAAAISDDPLFSG